MVKKQAEPAEFPDGEIEAVANYEISDPTFIPDDERQPGFHYYFAAADDKGGRADGVRACKLKGYVEAPEVKLPPPGCVAMKIPIEKYEAQRAARVNRANKMQAAAMDKPSPEFEHLSGHDHGIRKTKR